MSLWLYYSLALLLLISNTVGFAMNFASLPGNWTILFASALFCWFARVDGQGISLVVVGILLAMAIFGEVLEFAAGSIGAAKRGASRRAMVLSVIGSIAGSIVGAVLGIPIPIVGSAVAALIGGALGAAAGAAIGEDWKGRDVEGALQVGTAAFWGRLFGTLGKVIVGAIMLVIATVDSFW